MPSVKIAEFLAAEKLLQEAATGPFFEQGPVESSARDASRVDRPGTLS